LSSLKKNLEYLTPTMWPAFARKLAANSMLLTTTII